MAGELLHLVRLRAVQFGANECREMVEQLGLVLVVVTHGDSCIAWLSAADAAVALSIKLSSLRRITSRQKHSSPPGGDFCENGRLAAGGSYKETDNDAISGSHHGFEVRLGYTAAPAATLEQLAVPFETRVVSAHRTPDLLFE